MTPAAAPDPVSLEALVAEVKLAPDHGAGNHTRLQSIFDAAPAVVYVVDTQDRFVFVNRAWERTFGLPLDQVAGRSVFQVFPAASARPMAQQNERVLASGAPLESESVVGNGAGERIFATTKVPLFDGGERPVGVCGFSVDITERKRGESRLRMVSELAAALVMHGDDVDGFMDEMCRRLAAELGGDVYFHYRPERGVRRLRLAAYGGIGAQVARDLERLDYGVAVCGTVAATQRSWVIADVQASGDERTRLIRDLGIAAYACCALLCGGTLYGTLSLGRRKAGGFAKEDCELMKAVCDLAAVALDRAARAHELAEVDCHRKKFLAVLGHELRGPLAPIMAATELLRAAEGDAKAVAQARGVIERQAENLLCLVEELLDGARVSQGKITLDPRVVALDQVVGQGVEISRPVLDARGHALTVSLPAGPLHVKGDSRRLAQVVANLLANSAKFTPRDGHIALEVQAEAAALTLRVRDDGIGIEAAVLPRIFNLFEQARMSPSAQQGGLGIGLSLVKAIVELHGGSIEARSEGEGKGSEFTVRLPRLSQQQELSS